MRYKQTNIPKIGTNGKSGVLNGLASCGSVYRSTKIPAHTITKASNVPIETSSPNKFMGPNPAITIATSPVMMVVI